MVLVEYDADRGNPWVPHPLSYPSWERLSLETGFEGVACEATDFESGVGQFTKSVNVVAPFPWANRSSLARHLAAATASPVARCLPSISMPK